MIDRRLFGLIRYGERGPLTRFHLLSTRWFGVYLHRINRRDNDSQHHDHPWSFVSIVLHGRYIEERMLRVGVTHVWRKSGSIAYRRWSDAHRITHVDPGTWTLVVRGRDSNLWGFYFEHFGFRRWISSEEVFERDLLTPDSTGI